VFLTIIAILPGMLSERMNVPYIAASFFGGTSLLIIVGVILDTMRQIETHLIQRHYDGFLRKGRIRGRFDRSPTGKGAAVQQAAMLWMYAAIALLLIAGMAIFIAGKFHQ
jgi:preprotein translocase subunit SecY